MLTRPNFSQVIAEAVRDIKSKYSKEAICLSVDKKGNLRTDWVNMKPNLSKVFN